jgi:glycylpeptide N-tetradecanoyltransferase
LPTPIAQARYYHRSLNPKKLVDVNFSSLPQKQSMKIHSKIYSLPEEVKVQGLRPMVEGDVPKVRTLIVDYLR